MAHFVMFLSADGYQQPILVDPSKICAIKESSSTPGAIDLFFGGSEPITVSSSLNAIFEKLRIELDD